jgi:hypothetical protein
MLFPLQLNLAPSLLLSFLLLLAFLQSSLLLLVASVTNVASFTAITCVLTFLLLLASL